MGILKKTTEEINVLFDKVDAMPEEGVVGKTPVLTTGNTTTLEPGAQATSNVVNIGTDAEGNPKYRIDFGIPKGADGQDGSSSGGVADSVQWSKVLNKPAWVDSPSKPTYTASEVNAIAIGGLKTINGQSIEGEGNIIIEGGGSSGGGIDDAPTDGVLYGRKNNDWVIVDETSVNSNNVVLDLTDLHSITNHNSTNESVLSTFGGQAKMNEIALKLASNPMMYHAYNGYYMMKSMVDYNYIGNGNFDTEDSIMYLSISTSVPALKTAAAGLELFQFDDVELTLLYEKKANVDGEIKDFVIRHKFRNGYFFLENVKNLTNESTVDDFKNAFGEYKFDEYIQYSNDGNKFYVVDDTQLNGKLELYISAFNIENETFTLRCDKGTIWGHTDGAQMVVNYKDFTVTISSFTPEKSLSDAPKDEKLYARTNGTWVDAKELNGKTISCVPYDSMVNEVTDQPFDIAELGETGDTSAFMYHDFFFAGNGKLYNGTVTSMTAAEVDGKNLFTFIINFEQEDGTPSIVYLIVNLTDETYSTKIHKISGGIADAPADGQTYGRNNGNWVVVSNEGGGGGGTAEVNILDIYGRISSAGDGGKATQEDYNTLLNYANTNTKVTIELPQGYGRFPYVGLFQMEGIIVVNTIQLVYGYTFANEVYIIQPTLDIQLMASGTLPNAIKLDGYQKADSYTAITTEDSVLSAIAKLEAGIGGGSSGGGDNRYKLKKEIASIQTGSTSEEISTAVGGIDEYNAIIQAVKDGKKLYISEDEGYSEFMASIVGGNMLILQGIGMGFFGSNAVGVLNIVITDKGFEAYSYDVNITEVPSKS